MGKEEILATLKKAVETYDVELAKKAAQEALDAGIEPFEAINNGLGKGMETVSDRFDKAEIYLPQVMLAADAMDAALKILEPRMTETGEAGKGTVVIGTVEGDIHEIGKNVVAAMLRGAGYKVIDVGRDAPIDKFVEAAKENNADVVGASALMTTTMPGQREVVKGLKEAGLDNVKTIFGGAPCTQEWVDEIGGDAYCENAAEAIKTVDALLKR
ncbi:corrinoid protein [Methermicoccus shengliensis]|uniref:Dimethylamine methyltransferase n=1 Tax=Methermicoccus shengliensis TaxID=660064 RepID=A0A832RY63_9EURY|nr:corrinoid protein [Methermicoccus shengliensis]KUK04200.1 MAG: Putative cobalamin binding protein [Euryarchaeota archaeon 55_53]KUK29767.1 MAG: Putative cobalamin binding protein [Methanosarcinales archeaon 56_1174]MDI3488017.1 trimethylamine corrinoid protein [Methanosarcinales archaeon]MDN5295613.1 trimethylamine corrinoid protein [Methanosarcinales archaeon]HIH70403.1 dimethylamine methyltransferase [Methermicoccus shengliensis]